MKKQKLAQTIKRYLSQIFLSSTVLLISHTVSAQNATMNPFTQKQCADFKAQLSANSRISIQQLQVPRNINVPQGEKINIMYWVRAALNKTTNYPPLLLIHGGVGGNSSGMFSWKKIMDEYPGPIVSLDLRGEGCSNFFKYLQPANAFSDVTIEATLKDLETLRKTLFGEKRWRVFGQSRGSAIVHRYIEKYPEALESAHAHGLAMQDRKGYETYSMTRSRFNAQTGRTFYSLHPQAGAVIDDIRSWLARESICIALNLGADELEVYQRPQVCGAKLVDAFSGRLSSMSGWKGLADSLIALKTNGALDKEAAKKLIQTTLDSGLYTRYMSYIFGTNTREFHAPDPKVLEGIRTDPDLVSAPLSEGRLILEIITPIYVQMFGDNVRGSHQHYDFKKVRNSILKRNQANDPLQFRVYMSEYDPVAGPKAFEYEQAQLSGQVEFVLIEKSSHDGWKTHSQVAESLLQAPTQIRR